MVKKNSEYLMYLSTAQSSPIKTLTESLKEVLTDININFDKNGIEVPRTADEQLKSMTIVPKSEAQQGDLVFFVYSNGYAHHAGIYVGNNTILHSPRPGERVRLEEIWSTRVIFARQESMLIKVPHSVEAILEEPKTEDGIGY